MAVKAKDVLSHLSQHNGFLHLDDLLNLLTPSLQASIKSAQSDEARSEATKEWQIALWNLRDDIELRAGGFKAEQEAGYDLVSYRRRVASMGRVASAVFEERIMPDDPRPKRTRTTSKVRTPEEQAKLDAMKEFIPGVLAVTEDYWKADSERDEVKLYITQMFRGLDENLGGDGQVRSVVVGERQVRNDKGGIDKVPGAWATVFIPASLYDPDGRLNADE